MAAFALIFVPPLVAGAGARLAGRWSWRWSPALSPMCCLRARARSPARFSPLLALIMVVAGVVSGWRKEAFSTLKDQVDDLQIAAFLSM